MRLHKAEPVSCSVTVLQAIIKSLLFSRCGREQWKGDKGREKQGEKGEKDEEEIQSERIRGATKGQQGFQTRAQK